MKVKYVLCSIVLLYGCSLYSMEEGLGVFPGKQGVGELYQEYRALVLDYEENPRPKKAESLLRKIRNLSEEEREILTQCVNPSQEKLENLTADELYQRIKKYRNAYHRKELVPTYSLNIAVGKNAKNVVMILLAMKTSPFLRYRANQALPIHLVCMQTFNPEIFKLLFWSMQNSDMNGKKFESRDRCLMLAEVTQRSCYWLDNFGDSGQEKIKTIHTFLTEHGEYERLSQAERERCKKMVFGLCPQLCC